MERMGDFNPTIREGEGGGAEYFILKKAFWKVIPELVNLGSRVFRGSTAVLRSIS